MKLCLNSLGLSEALLVILISACIHDSGDILNQQAPCETDPTNTGIAVYLLADQSLTYDSVMDMALPDIVPNDIPWICSDDIEFYDFSAHIIHLEDTASFPVENIPTRGAPFLVTTDGKPCFLGSFWSGYSSYLVPGPKIWADPRFYPEDLVRIDIDSLDSVSYSLLRQALIATCEFRGGLSCTLDSVEVLHNDTSSSVKYTFTVLNMDEDTLYVLDPDKMGSSLFHYFTNGVYFHSIDGTLSYWSENKVTTAPSPPDSWQIDWHTAIGSDGSLTRTVLLDGYRYMEPGLYRCDFEFASPSCVEKQGRELADGRVWIGKISSSEITIDVNGT